jgi:hypothetical protein
MLASVRALAGYLLVNNYFNPGAIFPVQFLCKIRQYIVQIYQTILIRTSDNNQVLIVARKGLNPIVADVNLGAP